MKYYLISIGGTGAKCLEAFVHMNAAGLMKNDDEVKVIYVDPDASNGNLQRTMETVTSYIKAYDKIGLINGVKNITFFKNRIQPLTESKPWNPVSGRADNSLNDIFEPGSMRYQTENLEELFYALFTKEERTTSLSEGFRAHPSIGAAVIGDNMSMADSPWKDMESDIVKGQNEARIFIFGSVFGGTGAAGFPNIAKIIREHFDSKAEKGRNDSIKIAGCLMLPYFNFADADSEDMKNEKNPDSNVIVPDSKKFSANTYAALEYYNTYNFVGNTNEGDITSERPVFDAVYLLGDIERPTIKKFSAGKAEQKNPAHFLEMLAALAALDFFNKDDKVDNEYFKKSNCYMLAMKDDKYFSWDDFPPVSSDSRLNVKDKLMTFIRMAYFYKAVIYPKLTACKNDPRLFDNEEWVRNYLHDVMAARKNDTPIFGKAVDVFNSLTGKEEDQAFISDENAQKLEAFNGYCEKFLSWLKDITYDKDGGFLRCGDLINPEIFLDEEDGKIKDIKEDLSRIFKQKYNTTFEQKSAYQQVRDYVTQGDGVENLLAMLYDVCRDRVGEVK